MLQYSRYTYTVHTRAIPEKVACNKSSEMLISKLHNLKRGWRIGSRNTGTHTQT